MAETASVFVTHRAFSATGSNADPLQTRSEFYCVIIPLLNFIRGNLDRFGSVASLLRR
jgi:hypothetical protein